ncbi:PREDICTED: B3 domain-containing transcription repressor VAL1-like isoform X1 [Tarenaya hassleriana]|uniref:B3 domain-containing transcription repressor VAL1-like isoform X1 n=2 Tax=Tarenaya hassleriana TaxID=28532 RepID=UPI00053C4C7A|nr:PREDICTED: B3 domain-containing transcription repressor VAL1-like isoform X1 [Tarenaya hassleriana]
MGQKICMNASCATTNTVEWKKGWPLRAGGVADLCFRCGSAYESSLFCDTFHKEQSGWRECFLCHKRLHCGCIASKLMVELLDFGGVGCTNCSSCYSSSLNKRSESQDLLGRLTMMLAERQPPNGESGILGNNIDSGRLSQLCQVVEANEPDRFPQSQRGDPKTLLGGDKREEFMPQPELGKLFKPESTKSVMETRDMQESLSQPSLSMSLAVTPSGPPFPSGVVEGKKQSNVTRSPTVQSSCSVLPKPSKSAVSTPGTSKAASCPLRSARPPVEGRGRNHLLPRYWPRITDQELQQISGNLNSKIVPLFEKTLSASDAGRIGRLVLPKACAEAYFPSIHQSEGIPLKIQDVKGKEWTFQFRFWPNNNSRMYVLEGVTPCIQSMQLQAGDTVTFSRIDPGGKLVLGFRKTACGGEQQGSGLTNGTSAEDTSSSGVTENPSSINDPAGPLQMPKEMKGLPEHLSSPDGEISLQKNKNNGVRTGDGSPQIKEKKRTRNIGTKNKRLLLHNEESMELRLTWEEAQDLLRPSPSAKPTIVTIEDNEFEEYDEPPVFGKKTVFTSRPSGGQEQWAQCDDCSKWRRLPLDALLPSRWTCSDNVWDLDRCSCSVPEKNLKELESFLGVGRETKKQRSGEKQREGRKEEASGLEALASAAALGDSIGDGSRGAAVAVAVATTTRHPRHREGCSCIVCIQPPSGKGKHKPTCCCNVCMTVKRRFRTLMLRKKKKQQQLDLRGKEEEEEEEEEAQKAEPDKNKPGKEGSTSGRIDLNSDPYNKEGVGIPLREKEDEAVESRGNGRGGLLGGVADQENRSKE